MTIDEICRVFSERQTSAFPNTTESLLALTAENSLSAAEAARVALAIAESGTILDLSGQAGPFGDVPSTGGAASLTTLLCPVLLASVGVRVPKISASGSIAGAIDTLGLIPGFKSQFTATEFLDLLRKVGIVHCLQTADLCPADGALIAARRRLQRMADPTLAAISLLSKKLAVRGTCASFDFRVGEVGNIGSDEIAARRGATILMECARELRVPVAIALTDNRNFPSTRLGRLESLDLLWQILSCAPLSGLDYEHVDMCIELAGKCKQLCLGTRIPDATREIRDSISSGRAMEMFLTHVCAQGASIDSLSSTLARRSQQKIREVRALADGYWIPSISLGKELAKKQQAIFDALSTFNPTWQVGLELLRPLGDRVKEGDVVAVVRYPDSAELSCDFSGLGTCFINQQPRQSQFIEWHG